jgi:hypothetical protein
LQLKLLKKRPSSAQGSREDLNIKSLQKSSSLGARRLRKPSVGSFTETFSIGKNDKIVMTKQNKRD